MKKWMAVAAAACLAVPSAFAGIGAFGTWWDSKDYDALYGGGVRIGMEIFSGLGVEVRGSFLTTRDNDAVDMDLIPLEAAAVWRLDLSEAIKPYVGAGVGYYLKDVDVKADDFWKKSDNCVGYFALGGLNVELGPVTLFGEAKYNLIADDDEFEWRGSDLKEKFSLDGLSVNVGLKFGF